MPRFQIRLCLVFVLAILSVLGWSASTKIGPNQVSIQTDPVVVPVGRASIIIKLTGPDHKPVFNANIKGIAKMPGMNMGEREQVALATGEPGTYSLPAVFSMGGTYDVTLNINGDTGTLSLSTGENSAGGSESPSPSRYLPLLMGLALLGFVVWRVRKSGQRIDGKSLLSGQVIGAVFLLGAASAVAVWAVRTQRREGAMTPIEAQTMEMNVPAPEGAVPVELVAAKEESFHASVRYAGQVVGFTEQDIVARVTGTIVWMPGYVGDAVTNGQVLARLDTTSLDPEVAMKSAALARAKQGVGVMGLEHEAAKSETAQARAEAIVAEREEAEAKAMVESASIARIGADADITSAQAEVKAMAAEQRGAKAERDYAEAEYVRSQDLFGKGAISRDELQKAKSERDKAVSMEQQASQKVARANAMVTSAQVMRKRSEAEYVAATRKLEQSGAMVTAKRTMIRKSEVDAQAANARIDQERAMVVESEAGLRGAAAQLAYATLKSPTDGVILRRLMSPGQLVSAGQPILRVAQVAPIRVQANVAEIDLARIQVGASLQVMSNTPGAKPILATVTSVSPGVDPVSRTGVVEAILPNSDRSLRPGQFVSLLITVGSSGVRTTVSRNAIRTDAGESVIFVTESAQGGQLIVTQRKVQVGEANGDQVAILSGLKSGEKVVLNPPIDLRSGATVSTALAMDAEMKLEQTVLLTERGYEPASISMPAGKPLVITFIRKIDPSCGETLTFPTLRINAKLPLNQPTRVEIPAQKAGTIKFTCGMEMYHGTVEIR